MTRLARCLAALSISLATASGPRLLPDAATWGPVGPIAYADAQIAVPLSWPVVYPGTTTCAPSTPTDESVVLLGAYGQAAWCPPSEGSAPHMAGTVRLGPLPRGPVAGTRLVRNGLVVYRSMAHAPMAGVVYMVPSLHAELVVPGVDQARVAATLGPSVRQRALSAGPVRTPTGWTGLTFAGLRFAAPAAWATERTAYVWDCGLQSADIGLRYPPQLTLDTDTNDLALPCPYLPPPRTPGNGLVVEAGSPKAPNTVPAGATGLRLGTLHAFIDPSAVLGSLVLYVQAPDRVRPVKVIIGLGDAATVERLLGGLTPAS